MNASLISGLSGPIDIAVSGGNLFVSGGNLFVTNANNGTIGEYTTSGATVNASLITGLNGGPGGIAVVPEPSTFAMGILGVLSLVTFGRRLRPLGRL